MRSVRFFCRSLFSSLLLFLSVSAMAQGPWNFNNSADGWIAFNTASTITTGASAVQWTIKASPNAGKWNQMRLNSPGIQYTGSNKYLAITLKNETTNNYMVVGIVDSVGTDTTYIRNNSSIIDTEMSDYSTFYVDLTNNGATNNWTRGNSITRILIRARIGASGNTFSAGDIYIDKMEIVDSIPTNPTMTITSTTSGVTDGSTTSDATINLTFTSSEETADFAVGDITVTGGSLSNFTATSSTVYTATFTPSAAGATTVNVAAGTFSGSTTSLANTVADEFNWTYSPNNIPVIALTGDQIVEVALNSTYTDDGATATDTEDGTITSSITTVDSVDTSTAGVYTVTYNVSDSGGAAATEVVRTVTVDPMNFESSVNSFSANNFATITAGDTAATYAVNGVNNFNNLWTTSANINTAAGSYVALTIKNGTLNTRVQVVLNRSTSGKSTTYTAYDGLTTNDSDFKTYHIDMSSVATWTGTVDDFGFRFKKNTGAAVMSGDILIDKIAVVPVIDNTAPTLSKC